jgi:biotin transporter BioY
MTSPLIAELLTYRRKEARRKQTINGCITSTIIAVGSALIGGLWLMLAVGVIHHQWLHGLPTVGYWTAYVIVALLRGTFSNIDTKVES